MTIKKLDHEIMDVIVEADQDIYKDIELGEMLYEFSIRRKKKGLKVDVKYIKWLKKELLEEKEL